MKPTPKFMQIQRQVTAYIRDPEQNPIPENTQPEQIQLYRNLFFNNIQETLGYGFPVLHNILSELQWDELTQDFFKNHASISPYFYDIPEEFVNFLQQERDNHADLPFLLELAHYEWMELVVELMDVDIQLAQPSPLNDILHSKLVLNPSLHLLQYQYPVHKISPQYQPSEPSITYLAVYRNTQQNVCFSELSPAMARLLQLLQAEDKQLLENHLQTLASELQSSANQHFMDKAQSAVKQMISDEIIIGLTNSRD